MRGGGVPRLSSALSVTLGDAQSARRAVNVIAVPASAFETFAGSHQGSRPLSTASEIIGRTDPSHFTPIDRLTDAEQPPSWAIVPFGTLAPRKPSGARPARSSLPAPI